MPQLLPRPTALAWATALIAGAVAATEISAPLEFSKAHPAGSTYMQVRLLGALEIRRDEVDGYGARQLSGLAWDADAGLLYALSDDGYIVHLRPKIQADRLIGVDFAAVYPLREADGTHVTGDAADSEGLALANGANGVAGDTELFVSFEVLPRLLRYRPNGELLGAVELPAPYAERSAYTCDNCGIESLALHPRHGLLFAPEKRMRGDDSATLPVVTLDGAQWRYSPRDVKHSAIVGMEVDSKGDLLILERRYKNIFSPVVFALRRMALGAEPATPAVEDIVRFDSGGEFSLDNFESVARHEGERYFLVSDDNRNAFQRTVLLYFEIRATPER